MSDLSSQLKARALDEGFDLVGIASSEEVTGKVHLNRWLERGFHGGMDWMAETAHLRHDPDTILNGCRSVVSVAMSYRTDWAPSTHDHDDDEPRVWISRYAWGRDYHKVMKKRLLRVGRWLHDRRPDSSWRVCVDTAPILEREWAARAGLGWIGKNSSLLNRQLGSELFLGVLLTSVDLEPDPPVADHCGKCTACIDACPTGALVQPRILDSRRCISYLTIEHRGAVASELSEPMGMMVAGCDICQEVCPWTIKALPARHSEYEPAEHRYRPLLTDLEAMDESSYREWRTGSPLNRIDFDRFRRNLKIARDNWESGT